MRPYAVMASAGNPFTCQVNGPPPPLTLNWRVPFGNNSNGLGSTVSPLAATTTGTEALTPSIVAVMVALPKSTAVTVPLALTVAFVSSVDEKLGTSPATDAP